MLLKTIFSAETIILDASTSRVSCINLIDDVTFPQFPAFLPQFSVISVFGKEDGDPEENNGELVLKLGELELARGPVLIGFQGLRTSRVIVAMSGLVIPQPGDLRVFVELGGQEVGSWTAHFRLADPQNPPPIG